MMIMMTVDPGYDESDPTDYDDRAEEYPNPYDDEEEEGSEDYSGGL